MYFTSQLTTNVKEKKVTLINENDMSKNVVQEPGMAKFYSKSFGFLHVCKKDGRVWYNLTDVCRTMNITLHEVAQWLKDADCNVREYNVRRAKLTSCNRYVDNDGLSTILIMCCRTSANEYRRWIVNTVLWSIANPNLSLAINELDEKSLNEFTSSQVVEHYKSVAKERRAELQPTNQEEPMTMARAKTEAICETPKLVEKPFKPLNGHLLIEEWFRQEFPIVEFLGYIDGMIGDVNKLIKKMPKKDRWPLQHRVNVMTVFRKVLKANEGNIRYAPTPARAACLHIE